VVKQNGKSLFQVGLDFAAQQHNLKQQPSGENYA
jgi:hypothetical protein